MRLLNRLNQFQRLWSPSAGEDQAVSISELALRCYCSERHMRTLLRQMQAAGWLTWQAQSGRGKRGALHFCVTPERLRREMLEQALTAGQQHNALALAELDPADLRALLNPYLGGLWQNEMPTLRIPYYRSLEPLYRAFSPDARSSTWPGRFLAG